MDANTSVVGFIKSQPMNSDEWQRRLTMIDEHAGIMLYTNSQASSSGTLFSVSNFTRKKKAAVTIVLLLYFVLVLYFEDILFIILLELF